MKAIYQTIILKISGEALADDKDKTVLSMAKLNKFASYVKEACDLGCHVGLVTGAGNIWRGRLAEKVGIEQATGDYMGMLSTVINALALQSALEEKGLHTRVMSAINVPQVCEPYIRRKAIHHLSKGIVTIFAGGTGNPFFTTDSCATLRALEVGADAILMAKNGVKGVYDRDPRNDAEAVFIPRLTYHEAVERQLKVMDLTALAMVADSDIKIHVFDIDDKTALSKVLTGEEVGTIISK